MGKAPSDPSQPPKLEPTMSAQQLRLWAEHHHVIHWLDIPLKVAFGEPAGYRPSSPRAASTSRSVQTLATTIQAPVAPLHRADANGVTRHDKEVAVRQLQDAADAARAGIAEEADRFSRLQPPPVASARRDLWDRVRALRAQVRLQTTPRTLPRNASLNLRLLTEPPSVQYQEMGLNALCGRMRDPLLSLDLGQPSEPVAGFFCSCESARNGRCSVALTAIDALLEALADPVWASRLEAFASEVARPPWQRLLGRLDKVLASRAPAPGRAEPAVGWVLSRPSQSARPKLSPVSCRPHKKGPGFVRQKSDLQTVSVLASATDVDRAVAAVLPTTAYSTFVGSPVNARVLHALWLLAGHPRVFVAEDPQPWAVQRAELGLRGSRTPEGRLGLRLAFAGLEITGRELAASDNLWQETGYLAWFDELGRRCLILLCGADLRRLLDVLVTSQDEFDPALLPALRERWAAFQDLIPLQLGPELRGREVAASTRARLHLELLPGGGLQLEARVQPVPGGQSWPPGQGPAEVHGTEDGQPVHAWRKLPEEVDCVRQCLANLPLPDLAEPDQKFLWKTEAQEQALELLLAVQAAQAEGRLDAFWSQDRPLRVTRPAIAADLKLHVSQHRDWLGILGSVQVDGVEVPLEALLEAARERRRFVRVDERLFVQLERHFVEQLARAAEGVFSRRQQLEVHLLHAPAFHALADSGAGLQAPERWDRLLRGLAKAGRAAPRLPSGLKAELRPYQRSGYQWLSRLAEWSPGACLADDMGLGKTVQALAFLLRRQRLGPALVVAPTSVSQNWVREAQRFAPGLRPLVYRGAQRAALLADLRAGDLLVTSYTLLLRDIEALAALPFATVVWDEAQALKNPDSRRVHAATRVQGGFHLALTGTPVENRTGELWSLFRILLPGLLGSQQHFRERFVVPIERDGNVRRLEALSQVLRPFVLRRHKSEVEQELPERTEVVLEVELGPAEQKFYENVRLEALALLGSKRSGSESQRRLQILAVLTRLRQIACHPALYEPGWREASAKLEALRELVAELRDEGHRVLVFSQFTSFLDLVREALEQDGVRTLTLEGSTPEARRQELVDEFQAGGAEAFLISLRAGGVGLNLTAATYVILLDPWWNPAVESQAADRSHRIGQTRPVTVVRLIARGTIEESILELQAEKRDLVRGLLDGTSSTEPLSSEDLMKLMQQALVPAE